MAAPRLEAEKAQEARDHRELTAEHVRNGSIEKRHDGKTREVGGKRHLDTRQIGAEGLSHLVETRQVHVGGKRADHGTGRQKPGEQVCVDFVGIVDRLEGDAHFLFVLQ